MVFVKRVLILRLAVEIEDKNTTFAVMDVVAALQKLITNVSPDEQAIIKNELSAYLNYLLINDFSALVQILYRVDVSEQKIKTVLKENSEADAGDLLAELIIKRQQDKAIAEQSFPATDASPEEEGW